MLYHLPFAATACLGSLLAAPAPERVLWQNQHLVGSPWIAFTMLVLEEDQTVCRIAAQTRRRRLGQTPESHSTWKRQLPGIHLRKVDTALITALVRLPEASHSVDSRPTQLVAKVANILKWFEKYRSDKKKE